MLITQHLMFASKIQNSKVTSCLGSPSINNKLSFTEHVHKICDKASQQVNALARLSTFMSLEKRRLIMKAFVNSQFRYCSRAWIFHNRTLNTKLNTCSSIQFEIQL